MVVRMDWPQQFDNCTLLHGQTMAFPSSRLPCWLSTGNSAATMANHRQAQTLSIAVQASVVRAHSLHLITYWIRRRPREWLTCFTVSNRWDKLVSIWFRHRFDAYLLGYYSTQPLAGQLSFLPFLVYCITILAMAGLRHWQIWFFFKWK